MFKANFVFVICKRSRMSKTQIYPCSHSPNTSKSVFLKKNLQRVKCTNLKYVDCIFIYLYNCITAIHEDPKHFHHLKKKLKFLICSGLRSFCIHKTRIFCLEKAILNTSKLLVIKLELLKLKIQQRD